MKHRRGQVFSGEMLLAYGIFMLVFIVIVHMWNTTINDVLLSESLYELETTAVDVSESLLRTPGMPRRWNKSNVNSIGLVNTSRSLKEEKITYFLELMDATEYDNDCSGSISNYECNKHLTGIGVYDFYFSIEYLNGSTVSVGGRECTTGNQPSDEDMKLPWLGPPS